ncbi:hypothetical protein [Streptomyces capparidis]
MARNPPSARTTARRVRRLIVGGLSAVTAVITPVLALAGAEYGLRRTRMRQ